MIEITTRHNGINGTHVYANGRGIAHLLDADWSTPHVIDRDVSAAGRTIIKINGTPIADLPKGFKGEKQ